MHIRALVTVMGLATVLALPRRRPVAAAAAACDSWRRHRSPGTTAHQQSTIGNSGVSVTSGKRAAQKHKGGGRSPRPPGQHLARCSSSSSRPSLPHPSRVSAAADNCASYTGCSDEEYCIVWGSQVRAR